MHHRGFVAHMRGLSSLCCSQNRGTSACVDALRPGPGTLAEHAQVMVNTCGALITGASCRETISRFHDIGHHPVPLREPIDACRPAHWRFDPQRGRSSARCGPPGASTSCPT